MNDEWDDDGDDDDDGDYGTSEDDFDYDQYVRENHSSVRLSNTLAPMWRWTSIVLISLLVIGFLATVFG